MKSALLVLLFLCIFCIYLGRKWTTPSWLSHLVHWAAWAVGCCPPELVAGPWVCGSKESSSQTQPPIWAAWVLQPSSQIQLPPGLEILMLSWAGVMAQLSGSHVIWGKCRLPSSRAPPHLFLGVCCLCAFDKWDRYMFLLLKKNLLAHV